MYSSVSNGSWVIIIYGANSFLFFPEELTSLALGHLIRNSLFMTISVLLFLMSIAHWNGLWTNFMEEQFICYIHSNSFSQWTDLFDCQWACNSLETDSSVWIWLFGLITSVKANTFQSTYKTKHKVSIMPEWKNRWRVTCGDKNNAPNSMKYFEWIMDAFDSITKHFHLKLTNQSRKFDKMTKLYLRIKKLYLMKKKTPIVAEITVEKLRIKKKIGMKERWVTFFGILISFNLFPTYHLCTSDHVF